MQAWSVALQADQHEKRSAQDLNATHAVPSQYVSDPQAPQKPPQPSGPQALPSHWREHRGRQFASGPHQVPCAQVPQSSPHPSGPQSCPRQEGTHEPEHRPSTQDSPSLQVPQEPPQPSSPHSWFPQAGWQVTHAR
jgi:hypothetical protein